MIVKRTPHHVVALALVFAGIVLSCANGDDISDRSRSSPPAVEPVDEFPNPYNRVEPWAVLPEDMVLGAVIGAEPGPDGNVYVLHRCFENSCVDRPEDPILKLDPAGRLLASWGAGLYAFPHGFHVDPEGNVWTTDTELHQVLKFTSDGDLLMTLGQAGVAGDLPGAFNQPTDVVVGPEGNVYVTQGHSAAGAGPATHSRVARFSGDGIYVDSWGTLGSGPGELNRPHTIAIDSQDRLFVGDRSNNRIQIFDLDGRYLDAWTQFGRPSGIYITNDDTIYVADSESWGPDNPGWRKGIRVGSARDGSVAYFIEDIESMTEEHSGAEGVGVDAGGNVYGAVVRRRMLERHEPAIAP